MATAYADSWRRYRRWHRVTWLLFVGMYLLFWVLSTIVTSEVGFLAFVVPVMLLYGGIWAAVSLFVAHWRCPRCQEPFFRRGLSLRPQVLVRRCQHCGLPKYAEGEVSHAA